MDSFHSALLEHIQNKYLNTLILSSSIHHLSTENKHTTSVGIRHESTLGTSLFIYIKICGIIPSYSENVRI